MTKDRLISLLLAIIAVFLLASPSLAQTAPLRGQVVDETDAVIPGAKITLVPENGKQRSVTAGGNGDFNFANIPAGTYNLIVEFKGFQTHVENGSSSRSARRSKSS
jgi:hypothetical protein